MKPPLFQVPGIDRVALIQTRFLFSWSLYPIGQRPATR